MSRWELRVVRGYAGLIDTGMRDYAARNVYPYGAIGNPEACQNDRRAGVGMKAGPNANRRLYRLADVRLFYRDRRAW